MRRYIISTMKPPGWREMKISWKKLILFLVLSVVGLALLTAAWLIGYVCCEFRDGLWYGETVMSSSKIKNELVQSFGISIPDDARGLNYCIISGLDSTYHVTFRLERKKFDGFVRTIPERYGVRKSEKRDLPPPVSRRGNDVSWWDPPANAEYYSGSGQVNIVYDAGKETVYLYCFTI